MGRPNEQFGGKFMNFSNILSLLCGIAFFLFGMSLMGAGLKRVAGPRVEGYLWHLSSTPIKGFFLGTLVAAVIQSSGATSVMAVSFVNAGMMRLSQAICIVLGANLGTTMTGWLLTLSNAGGSGGENLVSVLIGTSALVTYLALAGIIMYMFCNRSTTKNIGLICLGLGTLLLSMTLISDAVEPLKSSVAFQNILTVFKNPILGILAGIVVAAILQSSSASVGILQALCVTGALPYSVCLPLILGINVGASSPVILAMFNGTRNGKRAAWSYLISNMLCIPIIYLAYIPFSFFFPSLLDTPSTVLGIAVMNTGMRVLAAPFLLLGHKPIEKICCLIVPVRPEENEDMEEIDSLNDRLLDYTPVALEKANTAALKMFEIAKKNLFRAMKLIHEFDRTKYQKVQAKEALVDKYEDKLNNFVIKMSKNELTTLQQAKVSELLSAIGDFERLSDHAVNIAEVAAEINEKKVVFSPEARQEIQYLIDAISEILLLSEKSFMDGNAEAVMRIEPLEEVVDMMCKLLKAKHIERLQTEECTVLSGFIFNDLLTNLERVADHCSNIAFCVQHGSNINAEEHKYSETIVNSQAFKKYFEEYRQKFVVPLD